MSDRKPSKELLETVAKHIRARRKLLGMTQDELAERVGLSTNYIAKLEIAMNAPSLPALCRLADALQVDVGALVTRAREFSHSDSAEAVGRMLELLTEQEEKFVVAQVECTVDLIVSMREEQ